MNAFYGFEIVGTLLVAVASLPVAVLMARAALMPLIGALAANHGSARQ